MQTIKVERQEFRFGDGWQAIKYDDEPYRKDYYLGCDHAVDIVAISPWDRLYFIEAKDYRGPRNSQEHREFVISGKLFQLIGQKVRCTVLGLVGGGLRWQDQYPQLSRFAEALLDPEREIDVLAWIEHDFHGTDDRARVRLGWETQGLKREVRWLNARALVANSRAPSPIPGLTVADLDLRSADGTPHGGTRRRTAPSRRARRRG